MSFANAPGMHLQHLVLDPNSTHDEKIGCLGILRTVVKNLADPSKSADPKYRQLRLSNDRVRARLSPCPAALDYVKALGFVVVVVAVGEDGAGECLRLDRAMAPSDAEASLAELDGAIGMLVPPPGGAEQRRRSSSSAEEERGSAAAAAAAAPDPASSAPPPGGGATTATVRVSEKERARALLEKKRQAEAREAKEARRRTSDLIKQGEEKKCVPPPPPHTHTSRRPPFVFFATAVFAPVP